MPIDAFIMRHAGGVPFLQSFLQSQDFEKDSLKTIARRLGITPGNRSRDLLAHDIVYELQQQDWQAVHLTEIVRQLLRKRKPWMSVKTGSIGNIFSGGNPHDLLFRDGDAIWYGPISDPEYDPEANWYIRPHFIKHGEVASDKKTIEQVYIRWLCFARVTNDTLSLHWRGFSHLPIENDIDVEVSSTHNIQYGYWYQVPPFFEEIENYLQAKVEELNLQQVVLHRLWNGYLKQPGYEWKHRRIRAESSGVSINAHAGSRSILELEGQGISHLASTIRIAVALEMQERYSITLPDPSYFDDIILRTIIREYGALSYEFSLKQHGKLIFRAHSYFGDKTEKPSQDSFPHMRLIEVDELSQLAFLLAHAE
jgi:hypothetical protein